MGTCTVHSWNDGMQEDDSFVEKGVKVNAQLVPEAEAQEDTQQRRTTRRRAI
jgi:hypothetical protein